MLTSSVLLPLSEIWSHPTTSAPLEGHQRGQSVMLNFPVVCYTSNLKQVKPTWDILMWQWKGKKQTYALNIQALCP